VYRTTWRVSPATRLFFKPSLAFAVLICSALIFHVSVARAQNPQADQSNSKPSVFRVKYVADGSLYTVCVGPCQCSIVLQLNRLPGIFGEASTKAKFDTISTGLSRSPRLPVT